MSCDQMYLPCCRAYEGCTQHFPPGIAACHFNAAREGAPSKITIALSKTAKLADQYTFDPLVGAGETNRISSLAVELLQCIASHLSLSSTAAFILCNRAICHAIGQESWSALRQPRNAAEKLIFLALLQKDIPFWLCENCETLHSRAFDKTKYYKKYDGYDYPFGYRLPSELVRMAVERAQKGPPHGICPDRLSCAGIFKQPGFRLDYAYRVRVVRGKLLLRMDVRLRLEEAKRLGTEGTRSPIPCSHQKSGPYIYESGWSRKIDSLLGRTYHHQADYPYVPQDDGEFGSGAFDPVERLRILSLPLSAPGCHPCKYHICEYCYRVTRSELNNADINLVWDEDVARSYQIVGSGASDDVDWMRSTLPCQRLRELQLFSLSNILLLTRGRFEEGERPRDSLERWV